MDRKFKQQVLEKWNKYFPTTSLPIGVFYSDDLHGAEYAQKPAPNPRGYTCIFAQMARLHQGRSLAFDADNLGCFGSLQALFGGAYQEEATVRLLCEIERFKIDREQANAMHRINPKAQPTGRYILFKPFGKLTEEDDPAVYFVFAKPDIISALHALASFDDTRVDNVIVPFGSGCEGCCLSLWTKPAKSIRASCSAEWIRRCAGASSLNCRRSPCRPCALPEWSRIWTIRFWERIFGMA